MWRRWKCDDDDDDLAVDNVDLVDIEYYYKLAFDDRDDDDNDYDDDADDYLDVHDDDDDLAVYYDDNGYTDGI